MRYYPAFLDLRGRPALVVGGGAVAHRKVLALLACGARVKVVAPQWSPEVRSLVGAGAVEGAERPFEEGDCVGAVVVIGATDRPDVNAAVAQAARKARALVNVVDVPALCDFLVPSVVARGDLVIAISTGGKSPALARRIREELEACYTEEYAWLLDLLGELRPAIRERVPSSAERRGAFWKALLTDDFLDLVRKGDQSAVRRKVAECISQLSD